MIKQAKNKTPRKQLTLDTTLIRALRDDTLALIAAGRMGPCSNWIC
jgi:hypothetical protein